MLLTNRACSDHLKTAPDGMPACQSRMCKRARGSPQAVVEAAAALPEAGPCEVRLGHAALTTAALQFAALPGGRDARAAAQQLLASAATASLADPSARAKRWASIRWALQDVLFRACRIQQQNPISGRLVSPSASSAHLQGDAKRSPGCHAGLHRSPL